MKKRNLLLTVVVSSILFIIVLGAAFKALAAGDGGRLFIAAAVLWLLGTIIASNWAELKPLINRLPHEDLPMN
ncbi:MAG TPA: hypothetical protein VFD16_03690 [Candidatus Saccharimonadales bacterium]|nr:hypothetical protein [Candidatus Saccharimonadales bacterium]